MLGRECEQQAGDPPQFGEQNRKHPAPKITTHYSGKEADQALNRSGGEHRKREDVAVKAGEPGADNRDQQDKAEQQVNAIAFMADHANGEA